MENPVAITVRNIHKTFKLPHERYSGAKQLFVNFFNRNRGYEEQKVLDDISFEIKKGEFFGIVGRNGSGKSTLLKLIAGIYTPDSGLVQVNGSLTPFIELGVGFNHELTGRENVFMNGALLGFSRTEMEGMYDDIVTFAELEKFMDQKLKNYSSGMQVRLAFSIAIRSKSDILLIDEVLAVGDAAFQTKCFDHFYRLKREGRTVVFVSHDRGALEKFCDRGILIEEGRMLVSGKMRDVLSQYSQIVLGEIAPTIALDEEGVVEASDKPKDLRETDYAKITSVEILDQDGRQKRKFPFGDQIVVRYKVRFKRNVQGPIAGLTVWDKNVPKAVFATNTLIDEINSLGQVKAGEEIELDFFMPRTLNDGEYIIEPGIANEAITIFYVHFPAASSFIVSGSKNPHSILSAETPMTVKIHRSKTSS